MTYVKIYLLVCSVFIIQWVYDVIKNVFNEATFGEILPPSLGSMTGKVSLEMYSY